MHAQKERENPTMIESLFVKKPRNSLGILFDGVSRRSSFSRVLASWWLDLAAVIVMLGSLVATIITLAIFRDQPLPTLPVALSINSLISIFGVVFKTSMLLIIADGGS